MNERAYAVFVVEETWFKLIHYGDGFKFEVAKNLIEDPPAINGGTALARFYADGLPESPCQYALTPMPGSTYTHAYFWRDDSGGITVIKGRYW